MKTNCAFREPVLLECDAASLGNHFQIFRDNMALSSKAKMSNVILLGHFDPCKMKPHVVANHQVLITQSSSNEF
jgi:hypothetical protein